MYEEYIKIVKYITCTNTSNKPKYILKGGITDFQPLEERYPYIENFIQKEYFLYEETGLWKILKINNN